ncbi:tRNA guanosine-2'-O-methyltransferase [Marchantia polymorpha subsp. ruderalis]|uniref:Subtilisin-like protease SBT2.5 n=2 Tax=Marchantia polymorpha TaxID=3197 RepID=A0A176W233_MARPO|nr:hypothetical protein AXG93_4542s1220 [Marchantia polymorpha subsp. ruderalis]PTQ38175.1 hypothetical protein MARPO_0053s0099 [Marchantia polymorpha]BBN13974.1 hypothetical protein Mp_6g07860 [Marchantia polymorpha subsp. ruderalis]|eukprot:PTQ38175.1 hypothetical protein MARPO_0053s0099 [Marchantia polymorpha]
MLLIMNRVGGAAAAATSISNRAMTLFLALLLVAAISLQPAAAEIYLVRMSGAPVSAYTGSVPGFAATAAQGGKRADITSAAVQSYAKFVVAKQDELLATTLETGTYKKLYSFHYLLNGFSVQMSPDQARILAATDGVLQVEQDLKVQKMTTHTPDFLGVSGGVWPRVGGYQNAGEGVVIGIIDTGIDPTHPSFASNTDRPYGYIEGFSGTCEEAPEFPKGSCNGKIIGARHFAGAAIAGGDFNASRDYASPFDADGHGSHTAATAAGNHGVPVDVKGYNYGYASGMAPRARIAVYKALYPFGGYISDVVAAVDQAVQDGVDIVSLSLGPTSAPPGVSTFLNVFDVELLFAVKAGVFVAQATGNSGPAQTSILSFSPWITSVAASITDRSYSNTIVLGNSYSIKGVGLSPPTPNSSPIRMVSALDAFAGNSSFVNVDECQQPGAFNRDLVQGAVLLCVYSFSFEFGSASVKQVADTAKELGATGFVLVADPQLGSASKADPSPLLIPGIVVTDLNASLAILRYYNESTIRDATGSVKSFGASVVIGDGRDAAFGSVAPVVATFSSRGPDILNSQSQLADVLKPDIMAPGYLIWSAWSPRGADESNFYGERFAMLSGTSMATPHIAGIAALIKQAHPEWSPAAITSALMTTANVYDKDGKPLLAQNPTSNFSSSIGPGTAFDFGAGSVNPTNALDPGLIFEAAFENYIDFLCVVPGVDPASVRDSTGAACGTKSLSWASDLNKPYITIANLVGSRTVTRTVTNVHSETETYKVSIDREPPGVAVTINPTSFTAKSGETIPLFITLRATTSTTNVFSFGSIGLTGSLGHYIHMPLSVSPNSAVS